MDSRPQMGFSTGSLDLLGNLNMNEIKEYPVNLAEVIKAKKPVYDHLVPTSLTRYEGLSSLLGADIYVKHENHNPTGTFKIRGGINLMHHLINAGTKGVITFSTGNHGLSVATSASLFGINATIVVPENNNESKNRKIRDTGAELIEAGKTFEEASKVVEKRVKENNLYYVHPEVILKAYGLPCFKTGNYGK